MLKESLNNLYRKKLIEQFHSWYGLFVSFDDVAYFFDLKHPVEPCFQICPGRNIKFVQDDVANFMEEQNVSNGHFRSTKERSSL